MIFLFESFKISIYALIPLLTLLQALIFSCIFVVRGKREERYSDFWLTGLLLCRALNGVPYMLGWFGINYLWENLTFYPWDGFGLAFPPIMYFFIQSLTNETWRFQWRRDVKFFIPYLIYVVYHFVVAVQGRDFAQWWWFNIDNKFRITLFFELLEMFLEGLCFWLSYRWYKSYVEWAKNYFSNIEKVSYQWFRNFMVVLAVSIFVGYMVDFYMFFFPPEQEMWYQSLWLGYFTSTVLTYYISIEGLIQTRIHSVQFEQKEANVFTFLENKKEEKTEKSPLSEELLPYKNKIINLFEKEKIYLEADLSLADVAQKLKTNISIVSQVVNSGFDKNFNDFVNFYRIEEFKNKINQPDYQHLTLLGIAFECGFNSKATFNRAFKKLTGEAPNDYAKKGKSE
jgi:AraC-like DNA-binding protein